MLEKFNLKKWRALNNPPLVVKEDDGNETYPCVLVTVLRGVKLYNVVVQGGVQEQWIAFFDENGNPELDTIGCLCMQKPDRYSVFEDTLSARGRFRIVIGDNKLDMVCEGMDESEARHICKLLNENPIPNA